MIKEDQKNKVLEFITRGEEIGKSEYNTSGFIPTISGPLFEEWMNEIKIFNDRYLKEHPLYATIDSTVFHHKGQLSSHKNMMGHLRALANDAEYWQSIHPEISTSSERKCEYNTMTPIIFISHRSEDAAIADMLRDYLVGTGIPNNCIFCSSLPGNDIKHSISREVKEKIASSSINIAILSQSYYESAYCTNEAGIIWLQDPQVPAIVVGLPEISHTNMYGFLNSDYKLRRLDSINDISEIYDAVKTAVNADSIAFSVVTAANQKLLARYSEYIKSRVISTMTSPQHTHSAISVEGITTDDELVVLYYILTQKVRRIQKSDVHAWLLKNEIYNINTENALDLLSTLGVGTYENETLIMDIDAFRKYTANSDELLLSLTPIVEKHQILSSNRFIEMWVSGAFTDEDKLFVAYIVQNRVTTFGARWMEKMQIESIRQWELNNFIDGSLASTYSAHLSQFIENQFVYESGWTEHGNAREYTLYPSLKDFLLGPNFPYMAELEITMEAHKDTLPF